MAQKSKAAHNWRGIAFFILFVAISGLGLSLTGNMGEPFKVFPDTITFISNGGQMPKKNPTTPAATTAKPNENQAAATAAKPNENQAAKTTGNNPKKSEMRWELFGKVLFNAWYLAATTAFIMLIGPAVGWLLKRFRSRPKTLLTRAPSA